MIGADDLSELALEQEMAAKADDKTTIDKGVNKLLDTYILTASEIKKVL